MTQSFGVTLIARVEITIDRKRRSKPRRWHSFEQNVLPSLYNNLGDEHLRNERARFHITSSARIYALFSFLPDMALNHGSPVLHLTMSWTIVKAGWGKTENSA